MLSQCCNEFKPYVAMSQTSSSCNSPKVLYFSLSLSLSLFVKIHYPPLALSMLHVSLPPWPLVCSICFCNHNLLLGAFCCISLCLFIVEKLSHPALVLAVLLLMATLHQWEYIINRSNKFQCGINLNAGVRQCPIRKIFNISFTTPEL